MFDRSDPLVQFKLGLLRSAMPMRDAIVFGDMYVVEGAYTNECLELGCERALLVDTLETTGWLELRRRTPELDFYKGDFSDALFMASIVGTYELGVAYDVLLHQAPLLHTLHLMLARVERRFVLVQPTLAEGAIPNAVVYLPGNTDESLHPIPGSPDVHVFDVEQVNHSRWIWGMSASFVRSALAGEGFAVVHEEHGPPLPNERWSYWGCVAERRRVGLPGHWSWHSRTPGLHDGWAQG